MIKLLIIPIITLLLSSLSGKNAKADDQADFYQNAAEFVYKLSDSITDRRGNICIYGYDQVVFFIEKQSKKDTVYFNNIEALKSFNSQNCKILYVSKSANKDYNVLNLANQNKIVSISFNEDFIDIGGLILMQRGRRGFDLVVNQDAIKSFNVKFNYSNLNLITD